MKIGLKASKGGIEDWSVSELGIFYAQNRAELTAHASRILKDSIRAEEIVQEALVRVLMAAPELSTEQHALGYLHRTIENICIDIFRAEGRRPNLVALDEATSEIEASWHNWQDYEEIISAADDAAIVRRALSLLSPAEKSALIMWEIEGRSTKEIAKKLGLKESSVRHTVSRARKSLKKVLSEIVVDEVRGLTALELLSNTYMKSIKLARKSSKAALSVFLLFFAILGFTSMPSVDQKSEITSDYDVKLVDDRGVRVDESEQASEQILGSNSTSTSSLSGEKKNLQSSDSALLIPSLGKKGIPEGFSVSDSSGGLGTAYFRERESLTLGAAVQSRQLIKTQQGAANILISQSLTIEGAGLRYDPVVSFGQRGRWIPLETKVTSTKLERQESGFYLLTAYVQVESAVETPIEILSKAEGRDLDLAPRQVITKLVLDSSKSRVIAQTVYVVDGGV